MADPDTTAVARLTGDRETALRIFDLVGESFDPDETACALFETSGGRWTVSIHFRRPPNEVAVRALVALAAGEEAADALVFETLAAKDWVKASLEGLAPVAAGRFLVHGAHDRARVPANRIGIEIEAALAFGTGHHGTTRGCLLALDRMVKAWRPRRVLDIGTGSGVLAIAAAKALRQRVMAGDIDPRAVAVARANARLNRVASLVTSVAAVGTHHPRLLSGAPFDLVLANILLGPLKILARPIVALLAPNGRVVLSGLLPAHANAALAAYRLQGLALERRVDCDGWVTLVLRRGAYWRGAG